MAQAAANANVPAPAPAPAPAQIVQENTTQLKLANFTGKEDTAGVRAFLANVTAIQGANNYNAARMAHFVQFALKDDASRWLQVITDETPANAADWDLLRPLFEARFLRPLTSADIHVLSEELKQGADQGVNSFWDQCKFVQMRLKDGFAPAVRNAATFPDVQRTMVLQRFINGVKKEIRDVILKAEIEGQDQVACDRTLALAIKAETALKNERPKISQICEVQETESGLDDQTQACLEEALQDTKQQFIEAVQNGRFRPNNNFRGRFNNRGGNFRNNYQGQKNSTQSSGQKPQNGNSNGNFNTNGRSYNGNSRGRGGGGFRPRGNNGNCNLCSEAGHFMRECPLLESFKKHAQAKKGNTMAIEYKDNKDNKQEVATIEQDSWKYTALPF